MMERAHDALRPTHWDVETLPYPKDRAVVAGHLAVHSWTDDLEELDGCRRTAVDSEQTGAGPARFHGKWKVPVVLGGEGRAGRQDEAQDDAERAW
jgi:hypothetical protein